MGRIVAGVLALLLGGFALSACGFSYSAGLPSAVTVAPGDTTLSSFEAANLSGLSQDFGVSAAHSVSCIMPTSWRPGKKATCYVYNASGVLLGTLTDTVRRDVWQKDVAFWTPRWTPSASYAATSTLPLPTSTTLAVPRTIFSQRGTGNASTGSFRVPSGAAEWNVDWSYNCANLGRPGSFHYQVRTATALDLTDVGPSVSGTSGIAFAQYYDTGTFHFTTISECDWTLDVVLP
jgi:hypothetical protein